MRVVAAGMHHADLLAVPFGAHLRGKGQVHLLGHRQRVHVGAQRHHLAGQRALQQPDHAGVGHAGQHFIETQFAQVFGDDAGGAELAVAEFGVGVKIAPPGDDLLFERWRRGIDQGPECRARRGGGGVHARFSMLATAPTVARRAARHLGPYAQHAHLSPAG